MFVDENYMRPVNKGPIWRIVSHKKTIKFWGIDLFMLRLRQSYTSQLVITRKCATLKIHK